MTKEKSYSEMRREFYDRYYKTIVPKVRIHENERKNKNILSIIIIIVCTIISLAIIYSIIKIGNEDAADSLGRLALFVFILGITSRYMIKKSFENSIKEKIMPIVCSCFNNLTWSNLSDYRIQDYLDSGVIPVYHNSSSDDIFRGKHKNVDFEILELELEIGSGKNRRTVFDGVVIRLDMNKNFSSHTIITPDTLLHASPIKDLRHTTLEDTNFEKKFDVFTNDEVDARYLITPTFMERLKNMKTAFKANKIRCSFYKQYLFVALSTNKDLFSLCSLTKPIDDSKQYFEMYEEIVSIVKLIDHFKLNQKIGL